MIIVIDAHDDDDEAENGQLHWGSQLTSSSQQLL